MYGQDSSASYSPNLGLSSWSGSSSTVPPTVPASGKGKQSASTADATGPSFLSILFDRDDYLEAICESGEEGEDEGSETPVGFIDPRLLDHPPAFDAAGASTGSPAETMIGRHQSARKDNTTRYAGLTHLSNRQTPVDTIRIHPNFNLRNSFGNMPFSSSVRANNYPTDVQDAQVNNLFLPTWAMMTVSTRPDPGSIKEAFYGLFRETTSMLESGTPVDAVIERHPNIAALLDEAEYNRSGILSKWSAGMVHSAQLRGMSAS
jgi:hypothetical protein